MIALIHNKSRGNNDMIKTNKELAQAVNDAINESGYKRGYITDQLGIANQNLKQYLKKQNFTLDDANKILDIIGYEITNLSINKKLKK